MNQQDTPQQQAHAFIRSKLANAVLITSLGVTGGVSAQEANTGDPVQEIIIQGEKTTRSLQETITSVDVTSAEKIREENIQTFFDIVERSANVTETYGPSGFTIRGISNSSVSGGGNGGLATVFVDGVPLPNQGVFSGPLNMWDVEQVEILRGPQSTLQGLNSLAGAVVVSTHEPGWDWEWRGRAIASDADDRSVAVAGGGPLIGDELAFRLAVENRSSDGFIYNPTRQTDENASDITNARLRLLWEPSALPALSVSGIYTHNERESGYRYTYARTDVEDYYDHRINESNVPNENHNTTDMLSVEANYELDERINITSLTAAGWVDDSGQYDGDYTAADISYGNRARDTETFTQEFRVNFDNDNFSALGGLYYSSRDISARTASRTLVDTPRPILQGLLQEPPFSLDPETATNITELYVQALPSIPVDYSSDAPQKIDTTALFADGSFYLTDRLTLLAGFRYDRESYTITSTQTSAFSGTYPDSADYGPYAPVVDGLNQIVAGFVAQAGASSPRDTRRFEALLPKAGLNYDWTPTLSTSFMVQRGYRSGGSQTNIARSQVVPFDQEFTWNYELALRSTWLDRRLTANANVFYTDWRDQQVSVNLGLNSYDTQTENAGSSHLYGAEFELSHQVSNQFDWYTSVGYTQTSFDEFTVDTGSAVNDLSDSEFAFAPDWTVAVGGTWRSVNGLFANINANYRTGMYASTGADQAQYEVGSRTLLNTKMGYQTDHWAAYLYADNLLDEEYTQYPFPAENIALLGSPRVIGLVLESQW